MAGLSGIAGSGLPPIAGADPTRPISAGLSAPSLPPPLPAFQPPAFRAQFYSIYQPDFAIASTVSSAGIHPDPPGPLLDISPPKSTAPPLQPDPSQAGSQHDQAASQKRVRLFANLSDIHARIAYANGTGDTGAAEQLQQTVTSINGELQGQTFAGIGDFPAKPFARPEIPNIYLNTAA